MRKKVAVLLSGCGHKDGSEIMESIRALYSLDKNNLDYQCFAPNYEYKVVNHLNGMQTQEQRNVLIESARIARGKIEDIKVINVDEFSALVIPGGFGVITNLCTIAADQEKATILDEVKKAIQSFFKAKKPIGCICIAPALVTLALREEAKITVTLGEDENNLINKLGGIHKKCDTEDFIEDTENKIFSCSAYMREDTISRVGDGIFKMIKSLAESL